MCLTVGMTFPQHFNQAFSSFCLTNTIRIVQAGTNTQPDFILDKTDLVRCQDWIENHSGFSLLFRVREDRGVTLCLTDGTQHDIIRVRLFHQLSVGGIPFLDVNAVRQRALFDTEFYRPDPVDQVLIVTMLYGFGERDNKIPQDVAQQTKQAMRDYPDAITDRLTDYFGTERALDIERELRTDGFSPLVTTVSRAHYWLQNWKDEGANFFGPFVTYLVDQAVAAVTTPRLVLTVKSGNPTAKNAWIQYIRKEFAALGPWLHLSGQGAYFIGRTVSLTLYLDTTTRQEAHTTRKKGDDSALFVPRDLPLERNKTLVRKHILTSLQHRFRDEGKNLSTFMR